MKYVRLIGGVVLMASLLVSCKQRQEITSTVSTAAYEGEKTRIETLLASQPEFKTFQSKLNITLNSGAKSISVNGSFKLIRDERIQVSIQPFLGIEMLRAEFSNDSIKMIDRINRRYVAESIVAYRNSLPVDIRFETLQSLFMNQLFVPDKTAFQLPEMSRFNWRTENDGLLIGRLKEDKELFILNFMVNVQNQLTQTQVATPTNTHVVDWKYSQFQPLANVTFPVKSTIQYHSKTRTVSAELVYSRIELDRNLQMSFDIPSSYTKINLADLVKGLLKQ